MIANLFSIGAIILMLISMGVQMSNFKNFQYKLKILFYSSIIIYILCGVISLLYFIGGSMVSILWIINTVIWMYQSNRYRILLK